MAFSVNRNTPWAFDVMKRNGLEYDSSLTETEFNFLSDAKREFKDVFKGLSEIPVCNKKFMGIKWGISGGIVLRLLPYSVYRFFLEHCCDENMCKIIYAHVWEFNTDQPERKVGLLQKIAQSSRTYTTPSKIEKFSATYEFISLDTYLQIKPLNIK